MIKKIALFVSAVIFLSLAGIFYLTFNKVFRSNLSYTNPLFHKNINQIRVVYPPSEINKKNYLVKNIGGRWLVQVGNNRDFLPARANVITRLVDKLTNSSQVEVISTNKQYLPRFDLDKKSRVLVEVKTSQDSQPIKILVGKMASDFQNTYVMLNPSGPVVLFNLDRFVFLPSRLVLSSPLEFELDDLSQISQVIISKKLKSKEIKQSLSHSFENDKWLLSVGKNKKPIGVDKIEAYFDSLKQLKSNQIEVKSKVQGLNLTKPFLSLEIIKKNKSHFNFGLYQNNGRFWLFSQERPNFVWQINQLTVKKIVAGF